MAALDAYIGVALSAMIIISVLMIVWMVIYRNRIYFKKTASDPDWKEVVKSGREPYERSLVIAVVCGVIIAFMAILFRYYFNDWQGTLGMMVVDLAVILVVAYPARRPLMAVGILGLLVLPAGYIDYGPYAPYIVGPIEKVTGDGSLAAIPKLAGDSLHCVTILLTNPMAFQDECELNKQKVAEEQPIIPSGIEIEKCTTFPEKDIYAGDPLELYLSFANKGGYVAKNLTIVTNASTGAKVRVCDENIFKEVMGRWVMNVSEVKKEQTVEYNLPGKVADPWKSDNCTYAQNKLVVDAKIKTTISYDYGAESSLDIKLAKSLNETQEREITQAIEAASPMAIYMHTSSPLSWLDKDFSNRTIQIRVKNEYTDGYTIFRGKYELKDVLRVGESIYETIDDFRKKSPISEDWTWKGRAESYDYCVDKEDPTKIISGPKNAEECKKFYDSCTDKNDPTKTLSAKNASECEKKYISCEDKTDPSKTIDASDADVCTAVGGQPKYQEGTPVYKYGEPVFKMRASKVSTGYDIITVYVVPSDNSDDINLSCGGNATEETASGGCDCTGGANCTIWYTGGKGNLKLGAKDIELVYGNLRVSATGFPEDSTSNVLTFKLNSNATYNVQYECTQNIIINNPWH